MNKSSENKRNVIKWYVNVESIQEKQPWKGIRGKNMLVQTMHIVGWLNGRACR